MKPVNISITFRKAWKWLFLLPFPSLWILSSWSQVEQKGKVCTLVTQGAFLRMKRCNTWIERQLRSHAGSAGLSLLLPVSEVHEEGAGLDWTAAPPRHSDISERPLPSHFPKFLPFSRQLLAWSGSISDEGARLVVSLYEPQGRVRVGAVLCFSPNSNLWVSFCSLLVDRSYWLCFCSLNTTVSFYHFISK